MEYEPFIYRIIIYLMLWIRFRKDRSSRSKKVSLVKGNLKICSKFTGEHPCRSNFIEITLRHRCSPVNLLHIFRTTFTKNTFGLLLLERTFYIIKRSELLVKNFLRFLVTSLVIAQKQPPEVLYEKRCSYKFCKIHRKTLVPESLF